MTNTAAPYRYRSTSLASARKRGQRAATFTVEELRTFLPADGNVTVLWVSFGHVHGVERFGTEQVRLSADGVETLGRFDGSPADVTEVVMRRPFGQGRTVRLLTRTP